MNILITGSSGFLGSALVDHSIKKGYLTIGCDIKRPTKKISARNYRNYHINLNNKKKLKNFFAEYNFDLIVHTSGVSRVKDAISNPSQAIESNIIATTNLLLAYQNALKVKKHKGNFIFISTAEIDDVYNNKTNESLYSLTKFTAENILLLLSDRNILKLSIFRPCTIYGNKNELKDKVPRVILENIYKSRQIIINSNQKNLPSYFFIDDIVENIFLIIEKMLKIKKYPFHDTLYLAYGEEASIEKIIEIVKNYSKQNRINIVYKKLTYESGKFEKKIVTLKNKISLKDGLISSWNNVIMK